MREDRDRFMRELLTSLGHEIPYQIRQFDSHVYNGLRIRINVYYRPAEIRKWRHEFFISIDEHDLPLMRGLNDNEYIIIRTVVRNRPNNRVIFPSGYTLNELNDPKKRDAAIQWVVEKIDYLSKRYAG